MADMFKLQVVTPDKFFYTGEVSMVELTTTEGEIGVYAQHIPMTSIVAPGVLSIHEGSEVKRRHCTLVLWRFFQTLSRFLQKWSSGRKRSIHPARKKR